MSTNARKLIPVACTLEGDDYAERAAAWRALIDESSVASRRVDDGVVITFAPAAAAELERLVAGEQACCAWADWRVVTNEDTVELRATAADSVGVATLHGYFDQ